MPEAGCRACVRAACRRLRAKGHVPGLSTKGRVRSGEGPMSGAVSGAVSGACGGRVPGWLALTVFCDVRSP